MGRDKALLSWKGATLLEHALATGREITGAVKILGPRERYARFAVPVIEDEFADCGPLAGIHAALGATDTDLNLLLAVDTPLVTAEFLRYQVERAEAQPEVLATVPDADGGVQATCAVYRRAFRTVAEEQLEQGQFKIGTALARVRVQYIRESEMQAAGFEPAMFANLNTPEDFARAGER